MKNIIPDSVSDKENVFDVLMERGFIEQCTHEEEIRELLKMLETTDAGTYLMHEGFKADNPKKYTRPWFSWSCSLFAELCEKAVEEGII